MKNTINPSINSRHNSPKLRQWLTEKSFWLAVRMLVFCLAPKTYYPLLNMMAKRILDLISKSGTAFTVLYLKGAYTVLVNHLAGRKVTSVPPVRTVSGIPSIIPGKLRLLIKSGDNQMIRAILTMLSMYRSIHILGKIKLETITSPFTGLSPTLNGLKLSHILRPFGTLNFKRKREDFHFSMAAGPNCQSSLRGLAMDSIWVICHPHMVTHLKLIDPQLWELVLSEATEFIRWLRRHGYYLPAFASSRHDLDYTLFFEIWNTVYIGRGYSEWNSSPVCDSPNDEDKDITSLLSKVIGGRLSEKLEAAGKVRVFAITDGFTQALFKPLHDSIFSLLKNLPTDGTWDQDKPVRRLLDLLREKECKFVASYDLSAATDRLPIALQEQVLGLLTSDQFAKSWSEILISRPWFHCKRSDHLNPRSGIYYAVGQPMGALSSWGMLALTHHVIVQYSALLCGYKPWVFTDYALLGDDIVIADKLVSQSYHQLVTEVLGLEINLSKSVISDKGTFEFAKRILTLDKELSPLGFGGIMQAVYSPYYIPSLLRDLHLKSTDPLNINEVTDFINRLPVAWLKKKRTSVTDLLWSIAGPFGFVIDCNGSGSLWGLPDSLEESHVTNYVMRFREASFVLMQRDWTRNLDRLGKLLTRLWLIPTRDASYRTSPTYWIYIQKVVDSYNEIAKTCIIMPEAGYRGFSIGSNLVYIREKIDQYFGVLLHPEGDPWESKNIRRTMSISKSRIDFETIFSDTGGSWAHADGGIAGQYEPPEDNEDAWLSVYPIK